MIIALNDPFPHFVVELWCLISHSNVWFQLLVLIPSYIFRPHLGTSYTALIFNGLPTKALTQTMFSYQLKNHQTGFSVGQKFTLGSCWGFSQHGKNGTY